MASGSARTSASSRLASDRKRRASSARRRRRQILHQHQNALGSLQPQRRQHHRHPRAVRAHILRLQRARRAQPAQRIHRLRARRGRLRRRQRIPPHLARLHRLARQPVSRRKVSLASSSRPCGSGDQQRGQRHPQQAAQHVPSRARLRLPRDADAPRLRWCLGRLGLHQGGRGAAIQCHSEIPPWGPPHLARPDGRFRKPPPRGDAGLAPTRADMLAECTADFSAAS